MTTKIYKHFLCFLFLSALPTTLFADKLTMKNGDIISGILGEVNADKIFIKPAYTEEFSVDANEVLSIHADTAFEIEMADGNKFVAKFSGSQNGEQVALVDGEIRMIKISQLAVVTEAEAYYQRDTHIDLGLTINRGNTDSQNILLSAGTRVKVGIHRHLAELTFRREQTDGSRSKEQDLLNYQYNWIFEDPWYTGLAASYERDPFRELDYRHIVTALFGRDIYNSNGRLLSINVGIGFSAEKIARISDSGAVGTWNLIYNQDIVGGGIKFFHNQNLAYQFFGNNNTIFKTNTGFKFNVVKDIYAKISLRYDYETEPAVGTSADDTTLSIGIGAKF